MSDQWQALLRNAGVWRGWFDTLDQDFKRIEHRPSLLTLEPSPAGVPLNLCLLFWPRNPAADQDPYAGEPEKRITQSFWRVDNELGVFGSGSFSRGTLFCSSWTRLYAEFGFLHGDRRHRLVLLWNGSRDFDHPVLIREVRDGSGAQENPALGTEQLLGNWQVQHSVLPLDDPSVPDPPAFNMQLESQDLDGFVWLPDGGAFRAPQQIKLDDPFVIEALWLATPQRLEWMQRCYDANGGWIRTCHRLFTRVD